MALARFQRTLTDTTGNVRNGVTVTIRDESTGGIAATFADKAGTTPKPNIVTDEFGFFDFYVASGRYRIQATGIDWRDEDLVTVEALDDAVTQAETARDAAQLSAGVYDDTTAGLAATSEGDYFSTPSGDSNEFLILYRHDAGPTATQIEVYPSVAGVQATDLTGNPVDSSTGSAQTLSGALDNRVLSVTTLSDLSALPPSGLIDGQIASAGGTSYKWVNSQSEWVPLSVFNVKTFGAVGDGVTDDTAARDAAFDAAISSKGAVFFPPGVYRVTSGYINNTIYGDLLIEGVGSSREANPGSTGPDRLSGATILLDSTDPSSFFLPTG